MTTIAYNHKDKQIAVDSRVSSGTLINTDKYNKAYKIGDCLVILAGSLSDIGTFVSEFPKIQTAVDCVGFCIDNKLVYNISVDEQGKLHKSLVKFNDAEGSGYAFAIAAMDFGKSAKDAIKYATTRDIGTGGRIRVYNVI